MKTEQKGMAVAPIHKAVLSLERNGDGSGSLFRADGFIMADKKGPPVDWESLLAGITWGKTIIEYGAGRNVFHQGQPSDSLFYLRRGKAKLAVTSKDGKEAIFAILDTGEFFGEGCLASQQLRMATATAVTD